jgi:hypothetical protein
MARKWVATAPDGHTTGPRESPKANWLKILIINEVRSVCGVKR